MEKGRGREGDRRGRGGRKEDDRQRKERVGEGTRKLVGSIEGEERVVRGMANKEKREGRRGEGKG